MSLEDFWFHISSTTGMLLPRGVAVDSPRLNRERIEEWLGSNPFLLRRGSVKGYESEDFDFLSADERERLEIGVKHFQAFKASIRDDTPFSDAQLKEGIDAFRMILEVIRPDKYADVEAFRLGKRIENRVRPDLPHWVKEMVFETGQDASGALALWIWVEVEDVAAQEDTIRSSAQMIREILERAALNICPDRWLYFRLRTESEQRAPAGSQRQ